MAIFFAISLNAEVLPTLENKNMINGGGLQYTANMTTALDSQGRIWVIYSGYGYPPSEGLGPRRLSLDSIKSTCNLLKPNLDVSQYIDTLRKKLPGNNSSFFDYIYIWDLLKEDLSALCVGDYLYVVGANEDGRCETYQYCYKLSSPLSTLYQCIHVIGDTDIAIDVGENGCVYKARTGIDTENPEEQNTKRIRNSYLALELRRDEMASWIQIFKWPYPDQTLLRVSLKMVGNKAYMCCLSITGDGLAVDLYCCDMGTNRLLGPWRIDIGPLPCTPKERVDQDRLWPKPVLLCFDELGPDILHIGYIKYIPDGHGNFYSGIFKTEFDTATNTLLSQSKKHLISDNENMESFSMVQDRIGDFWYAYTCRDAPASYLRFFRTGNWNLTKYDLSIPTPGTEEHGLNKSRVALGASNTGDEVYMAYYPLRKSEGFIDCQIAVETFLPPYGL